MVDVSVMWHQTIQQFNLFLNAPLIVPEMWWIVSPLLVTFVAMIFYFGLYKREELGWNTALGNTIVLLFVAIDLLRTMYYYTFPPSLENFGMHPVTLLIIFIIVVEAALLFYSAFVHALTKNVMFFLAAPLPVNLQAYVIASLVYLRFEPNWYTIPAALLLFLIFFLVVKGLQAGQSLLVEMGHKKKLVRAKELRKMARSLRAQAKKMKNAAAQEAREQARDMLEEAKALEEGVMTAEQRQHGELKAAKKLVKK